MTHSPRTWSQLPEPSHAIGVHLLGLVEYESASLLQDRLVHHLRDRQDTLGGLLLCEHPPMITIGREGSREHLLVDDREYESYCLELRWTNRGGGCLVHSPGQLAIYPIVPLHRLQIGLQEYRQLLEQSVIDVCAELKISAERDVARPGVWTRNGQIAHLGVAVKHGITHQGLFLNVNPDLHLARLVQPNVEASAITSLVAHQPSCRMSSVRESLIRHLAEKLGYDEYRLYTGHPLLKRTQTAT